MISSPGVTLTIVAANPPIVPIVRIPVPSVNVTDCVASTLVTFSTRSPPASISSTPDLPDGAVISGVITVSVPAEANSVPALLISTLAVVVPWPPWRPPARW